MGINKESLDLLTQARDIRGKLNQALTREISEQKTAAVTGALLSAGGFFFLGFILYMVFGAFLARIRVVQAGNFSLLLFFLIYALIFIALMIYSDSFQPESEYYLGVRWGNRMLDNPFTFRDNMDRRSLFLGLLLVVPGFVRLNLKQIINYFSKGDPVNNSTLASAILLLAGDKTSGQELLINLSPIGYSKNSAKHILQFLSDCKWIEINQEVTPPVIKLTPKGQDILYEAGVYYVPKKPLPQVPKTPDFPLNTPKI